MLGITPFGMVHTIISLIAVACGAFALIRDHRITSRNAIGQVYLWTTIATCITGFFIFHHGGFGKPHALGIVTLVVLAMAWVAGQGKVFGRFSKYVETIGYSMTFFFHMIPAITETTTRLPAGAPWAANPDVPLVQGLTGVAFVLFLIGAVLQLVSLRRAAQ